MLNRSVINRVHLAKPLNKCLLIINKVTKNTKIVIITLGGNDLKKKILAGEAFDNLKQRINILQVNGGGIDIPYYKNDYA